MLTMLTMLTMPSMPTTSTHVALSPGLSYKEPTYKFCFPGGIRMPIAAL